MAEYENLSQALSDLEILQENISAYNHALNLISIDSATAAPRDSGQGRGKTIELLSEKVYKLWVDPQNAKLLSYLQQHKEDLDAVVLRQVQILTREYDRIRKVPEKVYTDYQILLNDAFPAWLSAKQASDFSLFEPVLEKIVEYNRNLAALYDPDRDPYEVLIDLYEEGATLEMLDTFFERVRSAIVPLLDKIAKVKHIDTEFLNQHWPVASQRKLSEYLMDVLQVDNNHCTLAETEHPFTSGFNNKDVRITTHYHEDDFVSSMYSVIHECGHALYELHADDEYNYTFLAGGVSTGIHESQSRFYENLVGRSREFIHAVFPKIQQLFPEQTRNVTEETLWKAVNKAEASFIRTEADELTYPLHIMVRYQIEKELIHGTLPVKSIPSRWNQLYKEYLGIDVPNDTLGCLQDSHWSGGSIGYFPSYALGSAYAAQFLDILTKDLGSIQYDLASGDLSQINKWLKDHIHRYASFKTPAQIIHDTMGEFNPDYYTQYLTEKYEELYEIKSDRIDC